MSTKESSFQLSECHTPPRSSIVYSSSSIKRSLLVDKKHFRVEPNPSKRATASCWKVFGLPAMSTDKDPSKYEILSGFASCKTCFDTYKYIDSSTCNLNNHRCCRDISSDQLAISSFLQSPRSTTASKLISKRKQEIKQLCAKWVAASMRSFKIVNDRGLKDLIQACLDIGHDFRSETRVFAEDLLPTDRTVKNELDRLANHERNILKKILTNAAENMCLSISPDNWTDNHRRISYMGATVHYVDKQCAYHSVDLFCVEFVPEKKSAENIYQLMQQQLTNFGLETFMDTITYVTDRGANFIKAFRSNKVLLCVVHRMNNVVKRCFFQNPTKKCNPSPGKLIHASTSSTNTEMTPMKMKTVRTAFPNGSPEIEEDELDITEEESDSEDEESDDDCDYTPATVAQLSVNSRQFIDTIKNCKALVRYIKKASMNRQLQRIQEQEEDHHIDVNEECPKEKRPCKAATLHQSSIVRWLSLSDLLESIKNAYPNLVLHLNGIGQSARIQCINIDLVDKLISFLRPWKIILQELQSTNTPSLFLVLPCITYLNNEFANGAKREKGGIRFFYKRATQLLSTMFTMEDDYIIAAFLHPNYKQLRGATNSQISDCHSTCRLFLVPASPRPEIIGADENYEPPSKKIKSFMSSLMDKKSQSNGFEY